VRGASGGTGAAVVRELAARGLPVRAVTRSGAGEVPEGVGPVASDVGTPEACKDAPVVYMWGVEDTLDRFEQLGLEPPGA
jgi:NAD(P)-dependent dehydrogenase (short-subunit alcohol dehydrogenase family)